MAGRFGINPFQMDLPNLATSEKKNFIRDMREEWTGKVFVCEAKRGNALHAPVYRRALHLPYVCRGYIPNVAVVWLMLVISACRLFNGPP